MKKLEGIDWAKWGKKPPRSTATYVVRMDTKHAPALYIRCLNCGLKSYNVNDIEQKYCGHCKTFHHE